MKRRLISIGMPVRNGAAYLDEAIQSILGQSYGEIEVLISDNASDDATEAIVREYARADRRIVYFRHDVNVGANPNHNFVFARSRGELFKWAAHDDLVAPEFLDRCVRALDEQPSTALAFSSTTIIDEQGAVTEHFDSVPYSNASPSEVLRRLLLTEDPFFIHCFPVSGLIRSDVLRQTSLFGGFRSADKVLLVELGLRGGFALLPERLFMRRWHPGTSIRAHPSPVELAQWLDAARGSSFPMPRTTILRGYVKAVARTPMSPIERARCFATIGSWLRRDREWRVIGGEFRIVLRERRTARALSSPPHRGSVSR